MTKKEMELKIEGLEKDLKTAYEVIKTQHKETENIHLEYKSLVSQKEYDTLLKRYGKLEETYKELLSLYKRQEEKLEKIYRRNRAGRKSKMTEELTVNIYKLRKENISIRKIAEKLGNLIELGHKRLHL